MFAHDQWNEPSTYAKKPNNKAQFDSLDQIFLIRKQQTEHLDAQRATSQILSLLRILGGENLFGIICFQQETLLNLESLLQLMHFASDGNFLSCQPRVIPNRNFVDDLLWFNPQSFQTLGCWLVNELEKSIALNFKKRKIQLLEINCCELETFWKDCDKNKLISQAYFDYKEDKWYQFLAKNRKKHDEAQFRQICEKDELIRSMVMTTFSEMSK